MENIIKFKNLIEAALAKYPHLKQYRLPGEMNGRICHSSQILRTSNEILIGLQQRFIEDRHKADDSTAFIRKGVQRIEGLFLLPTYSATYEFTTTVKGENPKNYSKTFHYDFESIEKDLPQGRIKRKDGEHLIPDLLATANFYLWLKELEKETPIEQSTPTQGKRLIWNGAKNALAYIFFQLKYEHLTESNTPVLDASNEDLAEFLKANFECFKDDKITSIMAMFENREKHPQKGKNRFVVSRGTTPKE